jgi:GH15 family glucan-1,4-alpha-glucosidase
MQRNAGVLATDRDDEVVSVAASAGLAWSIEGAKAHARLELHAGDEVWLALRYDDDDVHPVDSYRPQAALDATAQWWDQWLSQMTYRGPYRQEVERSALALKLCTYEPTGAIVAAPTTSLPEWLGGDRNWDYRFTWLRDSAFVLYALDRCGFEAEGSHFMRFLNRVARRRDRSHLQIMYGVDGMRELPERVLDHLGGYADSRPVRVGNAAAGQLQMDVYGELFATMDVLGRRRMPTESTWHTFKELADWTAAHWRRPDLSIWEPRNEPRHFVYSKVMAWVALDRAAAMAEEHGLPGDVAAWKREATLVHAEVLERGWDAERRTFVQAYGEPQLDAALLAVPKMRFLPRADDRVRSTLAAVRRELATGCEDLVYRYRAPDGVGGEEGAFIVCSFWMVQNLAMLGELDEAERLFRLQLRRASPLGLFAEEIDPRTGQQLGNYPLALSHAALINTAMILGRLRSRP